MYTGEAEQWGQEGHLPPPQLSQSLHRINKYVLVTYFAPQILAVSSAPGTYVYNVFSPVMLV